VFFFRCRGYVLEGSTRLREERETRLVQIDRVQRKITIIIGCSEARNSCPNAAERTNNIVGRFARRRRLHREQLAFNTARRNL